MKYHEIAPRWLESATGEAYDLLLTLAMGIPAVCLGGFRAAGGHTREEYLEIDSIPEGIGLALELVPEYFA